MKNKLFILVFSFLLLILKMQAAKDLIDHYKLEAHPEGGYYRETYRSAETIVHTALPGRFIGERSFSTAIYFLLEKGSFSAFHRIKPMNAGIFIQAAVCSCILFIRMKILKQ